MSDKRETYRSDLIDSVQAVWFISDCAHEYIWISKEERSTLEKRFRKKFKKYALVMCTKCKRFQYTT